MARKNPASEVHAKLAAKFYKLANAIRRKKDYADAFKYAVMARTEAEHGSLDLTKYLVLEADLYQDLTGKQMWESPWTETSHLNVKPKTSKKKTSSKKKKRKPAKKKTATTLDLDFLENPFRRRNPLRGSNLVNPSRRRRALNPGHSPRSLVGRRSPSARRRRSL